MGRADLRNRIHWWDTVGWRLCHSARGGDGASGGKVNDDDDVSVMMAPEV